MDHIEIGKSGEVFASEYLIKNGYKIKHRNYRWHRLELDIVCMKDNMLIVVEVKTRTSEFMGEPFEAVSKAKQKQIIKATGGLIQEFEYDMDVRFDIISIIIDKKGKKLEHIEDAFYPIL